MANVNVGGIVKFHGLDGQDHNARVTKVHSDDVVDLELVDAGTQKRNDELFAVRRGDHGKPFSWHQ